MKGEAYYYVFSIMLVAYVFFYFVMLAYFKLTGKTLYGIKYKRNSTEYKSINKVLGKRHTIIASLLAPTSIINLLLEIRYLAHEHDPGDILIVMPIFIAVLTIIIFIKIYDEFIPLSKKRSNNKNNWPTV